VTYLTWVIRARYDGEGCLAAINHQYVGPEAQKRSNTAYQGTRTTQPSVIPVALPKHAAGQRTRTTIPTPPSDPINVIQLKQNGHPPRSRAESSRAHTTLHIVFLKLASRIALGREPSSYSEGPLPQTFCAHSPEGRRRIRCRSVTASLDVCRSASCSSHRRSKLVAEMVSWGD
jgi:hypothetical protein